jgi:hypothetical protein
MTSLQESKNEWCSRLVNILTPLIQEGFNSIFKESYKLCEENDELDKYLMTFQNFITRIPKWNQTLVKDECDRIVQSSGCNYLEDLISCVHIIQLKVLTCIRVGNKQKKIDINIPKFEDFIHQCYIFSARSIYTNVYLFDINISPLQKQKHIRELHNIIQDSILNAIRQSIPVENILRNYMDETTEEDVIEEIKEEKIPQKNENTIVEEHEKSLTNTNESDNDTSTALVKVDTEGGNNITESDNNVSFNENLESVKEIPRNEDLSSKISSMTPDDDDEYDSDEDYEPLPKISIHNDNDISLDTTDVHDVSKKLAIEPEILLNDIEILG